MWERINVEPFPVQSFCLFKKKFHQNRRRTEQQRQEQRQLRHERLNQLGQVKDGITAVAIEVFLKYCINSLAHWNKFISQ